MTPGPDTILQKFLTSAPEVGSKGKTQIPDGMSLYNVRPFCQFHFGTPAPWSPLTNHLLYSRGDRNYFFDFYTVPRKVNPAPRPGLIKNLHSDFCSHSENIR